MGSKSAEKQARASKRKQLQNKSVRSQTKTSITNAENLLYSGELELGRAAVLAAIKSLDKAAEKGAVHRNNAARRKSRLMKKLNQAPASPPAKQEPAAEAKPQSA